MPSCLLASCVYSSTLLLWPSSEVSISAFFLKFVLCYEPKLVLDRILGGGGGERVHRF